MENYPTYSQKQRQLYKDKLDLNTEKKARLEILSQNQRPSNTGRKDQTNP